MTKDRRLYAKFDIGMDEHAKIVVLSDAAFRALFESTLYSRRQLTDGFLDERIVLRKWGANIAAELTSNDPQRPSWIKVEGGWAIHDFAQHQTTNEDIAKKREAGRKGGLAKAEQKASKNVAPASEVPEHLPDITLAKTETETETSSSSEVSDETPRPDVTELLDLLDACIEQNGFKKPSRTKKNTDAARLLIDKDGYDVNQVSWMIRWATNDEFWRTNILSMSKLREKFDQLKAKAGVGNGPKPATGFNGEIDVDAILGRDVWTPPSPPAGLSMAEEIEWKKQQRAAHKAERLAQARKKLGEAA